MAPFSQKARCCPQNRLIVSKGGAKISALYEKGGERHGRKGRKRGKGGAQGPKKHTSEKGEQGMEEGRRVEKTTVGTGIDVSTHNGAGR